MLLLRKVEKCEHVNVQWTITAEGVIVLETLIEVSVVESYINFFYNYIDFSYLSDIMI